MRKPEDIDNFDWKAEDDMLKATRARLLAGEPWEPVVEFTAADLPPFPVEQLPPVLADFVRAEAEFTQTPVDMAAMLSLAACASAIGKAAVVEIKPGYIEPLNLFVAVVLPPGERKSAVVNAMMAPIKVWEQQEAERLKPAIAHAAMKVKTIEKQIDTQIRNAAKAKNADHQKNIEAELEQLADKLTAQRAIIAPKVLVDDSTPEALVSFMAMSGGRAAQLSAEGGVFSMLGGRYSDKVNLDAYLKGHAGDDIRVDRKGRPSEYVPEPALSLGLAVQPSILESFQDNPQFRGVGLLARFLYSLPKSKLGEREVDTATVPEQLMMGYAMLVLKMLTFGKSFDNKLVTLKMTPDARAKLFDFARWLEPQLAEFAELEAIRDWASKLSGAISRIAGIFSVVRVISLRSTFQHSSIYIGVNSEDIDRAIAIGGYLVKHALAAFSVMGMDEQLTDAKHALRCIRKHGWSQFTRSQIQQQLRYSARFREPGKIDAALHVLEQRNFIRPTPVERKGEVGRKPGPAFDVNPFSDLTTKNPNNPNKHDKAATITNREPGEDDE